MPLMKVVLRTSLMLCFCLLALQSCGIFSFTSSTILPADIKTFSIQKFYIETTDAPLNIANDFTELLGEKILHMTPLIRRHEDGDIQYKGTIKSCSHLTHTKHMHIDNDPAKEVEVDTLTIIIEVSYINTRNQEDSFKNKLFSASSSRIRHQNQPIQESELIHETMQKLVDDIYSSSIDNW